MRARHFLKIISVVISFVISTQASIHPSLQVHNDDDLESFVSRPDIRAPKFKVKQHQSYKSVSPGFFFVAPYTDLLFRQPSSIYVPGQTGPHIYDGDGNLVWSGAHLFGHRPTFDFKMSLCDGQPCLTFILHVDLSTETYTGGAGVILDTSFDIRDAVVSTVGRGTMNMHEFTVTNEGTAMYVTYSSKMANFGGTSGFLGDNGFREVDMQSGDVIFEWWALDHVDPTESMVRRPRMPGSYGGSWDFFHLNSIDKNADGDYLISSRYFNSIYKISGKNGEIIWQLGGTNSSFVLNNFDFSSQHHARFIEESPSHVLISFLNNAADDNTATATQSSAMYVRLDLESKTATLLKKFNRPDRGLTRLRGSAQILPNNNLFVSWSENALVSEFDANGTCLFEGQFAAHRFVTYRAYKFNLTATPSEPPRLAARVYASAPNVSVTALYVSWNGATEVTSWRFHGADAGQARLVPLGDVKKTGFETALMVSGSKERVYAEALAADGIVLGNTGLVKAMSPVSVSKAAEAHEISKGGPGAKIHATPDAVQTLRESSADDVLSFKGLAVSRLWPSPTTTLVLFLTPTCITLCLALAFALYKIRRLSSGSSLDSSYTAVKSDSLE